MSTNRTARLRRTSVISRHTTRVSLRLPSVKNLSGCDAAAQVRLRVSSDRAYFGGSRRLFTIYSVARFFDASTRSSVMAQAQWNQIVAKALTDVAFKQRLLAEPTKVFKEQGIDVPAGVEIRV